MVGDETGKGDTYRPVDYKKYSENYNKIFNKKVRGKDGRIRKGDGTTRKRTR